MGASERDSDACPVSAYEGGDDAYRVFRKMLDSGHPPGDWDQLLSQARAASVRLKNGTVIDVAPKQ